MSVDGLTVPARHSILVEGGGEQLGSSSPVIPDHVRAEYANAIEITYTPFDFRLVFGLAKTPMAGPEHEAAVEEGVIRPEAVAEIVLAADFLHNGLMRLQQAHDAYVDEHGVPRLRHDDPDSGPTR